MTVEDTQQQKGTKACHKKNKSIKHKGRQQEESFKTEHLTKQQQ